MARTIRSANLTAAQSDNVYIVDFVKVTVDPNDNDKILKLSNFTHDLTFGGDTYLAVGQYLGFSTISDDLDTKDNSISVSLSGIGNTLTAILLGTQIDGSPVEFYRGYYNKATGTLVADPELRWSGFVNNAAIKDNHRGNAKDTIALALNCKSLLTTILKRKNGRFTSSSGIADKSFDFMASMKNFHAFFGKET